MPRRLILNLLLVMLYASALAQQVPMRFQRLTYNDGLSDNKVNCILKSKDGFLWIGTPMGLNRYDGFRVQSFYNRPGIDSSLPDNAILNMVEDGEGLLWLDTPSGLCIFNPTTDAVNRNTEAWMKEHGMTGRPLRIASDKKRNVWVVSSTWKLYYYDFASKKVATAPIGNKISLQSLTWMTASKGKVYLILDDGTVAIADSRGLMSVENSIPSFTGHQRSRYRLFVDSYGGIWVWSQLGNFLYNPSSHSWKRLQGFVMSDISEDDEHHFLIATDHSGLLIADSQGNIVQKVINNPVDNMSLPDNTLQCVYVDNAGIVWLGMYRLGLVHYYKGQDKFSLLSVGDICAMTQSGDGSLWLGTNDSGIGHYDFKTGRLEIIPKQKSGLGSDVVVSCLASHDGSLWFGSFQGGMVRLKGGAFTHYDNRAGQLTRKDIWSLAELPDGHIAIGTLGGGLQLLDPNTGKFTTLSTENSKLPSDFISSISVMKNGWIALGHSQGVSLLRLRDHKVVNIGSETHKGKEKLTSLSVNQVYSDSRGLLWIATASGLNVYDVSADRIYTINLHGERAHAEVNAVGEDKRGIMWLSSGNEVKRVSAKLENGEWHFFSNAYGSIDGVQTRLFNKRSILCLNDGSMLFGGIDGVNVIRPHEVWRRPKVGKVLFSGLSLFDHPVGVRDTINGHVILSEELNDSRKVILRHDENTFSVLLASSVPGLPETPRFLYRIKGKGEHWLITSAYEPMVQFTNLSPGKYILEVRAIDADDNPQKEVSSLEIVVRPPFYNSVWAWIIYIIIIVAGISYGYWRMRKNQLDEMEKLELKKQKELEESKLVFFTNMGHELRTPLTLILSPLESIISRVHEPDIVQKLRLMQRNGQSLLSLVNQMLDLRRIMRGKEILKLSQSDIIPFIKGICDQFAELSDKGITLTFHTEKDSLIMTYDQDKVGKILSNLLSNAYKFTPANGRIDVSVRLTDAQTKEDGSHKLTITVADNGIGISDEDKSHLFERFYQSPTNKKSGGSGIGLNLVWEYAKMHGGNVTVKDNPGGGTVFTVTLPIDAVESSGAGYVEAKADNNTKEIIEPDKSTNNKSATSTDAPKATILLVDDNEDFLNFLESELSPYYYIQTAKNGQQALDSINTSIPDLVLTDVMMPVMDGNELCRHIKSDNKLKQIPVVMLTARLSDENEIESRECGADDYVKKPFSMQLLRMRIDHLVAKDRISDEGKIKPRIAQPKITSEDEKFVDKATKYVEAHLDDADMSVEQMAQDIGMSRVQLYRRLVTVVGKTPSEFIRLIRLRHALRLLMESQLTVSEIAFRVGFSSQRYFSKCFKDLYGYLPTEYKRKK